jgi:hypothetical protein
MIPKPIWRLEGISALFKVTGMADSRCWLVEVTRH